MSSFPDYALIIGVAEPEPVEPKLFETWSGAGVEIIVLIFPIVSLEDARMKKTLYCFSRVLSVLYYCIENPNPDLFRIKLHPDPPHRVTIFYLCVAALVPHLHCPDDCHGALHVHLQVYRLLRHWLHHGAICKVILPR